METLNEASLSRVWQHFNDPEKTIVIFTAFRDERTYKENVQMNKKFAAELKKAGFGYFFVDGHFPENEGTEDEVEVKEDSIFAIGNIKEGQKLINLAHKLANSANQDSIIVKGTDGKIFFLDQQGKKDYLQGGLKPGAMGKYYTKLRNKSPSNVFVFESEKDGAGFFKSYREFLTGN